jgi:HlyD family secretion protein
MSARAGDLSVLSRGAAAATAAAGAASRAVTVPEPRRRWASRVLLPLGMAGAVLALLAYASRDALLPATEVRVVPVVVRAAVRPADGAASPGSGGGRSSTAAEGSFTLQAPGWVEPEPYPVAVTALADGVVEEVLVLEGDAVKKGDVVARLVPDDARLALAQAGAAVRQREGELAAARAAHAAARAGWDNPVERTRAVAAGEAALAESRAELERLPSLVAAEQSRADELADAARRKEQSAASSAASASELVQAKLKAEAQQALLASTRANGPVLEARVRQQEAELAAAREAARLRIAERQALDTGEAAVTQAQGALDHAKSVRDEARLRLARMEVRAPADGVVMSRHAEPGSAMMLNTDNPRSAHAVRLYDPAKLQVRVDVPLADAARVTVGQRAQVVVGVLPDRTFAGVVTRVVPEADIQRNTLQVKVRIDDPAPQLRPEMLARVRFADAREVADAASAAPAGAQQVFAPESMLKREGRNRATVWVFDPERGEAAIRTVTLGGGRAEGWVAIADGLRPGDELIAEAASPLRPGSRVKVVGEAEVPAAATAVPAHAAGGPDAPEGGTRAAH